MVLAAQQPGQPQLSQYVANIAIVTGHQLEHGRSRMRLAPDGRFELREGWLVDIPGAVGLQAEQSPARPPRGERVERGTRIAHADGAGLDLVDRQSAGTAEG